MGIDGCRAGWFYVTFTEKSEGTFGIFKSFAELEDYFTETQQILVDIPMGFRDIHPDERDCDRAARKILGKRGSTIFPVPVRSVLTIDHYPEASAENFNCSGRRLSKQTWNIVSKIREVDDFMQQKNRRGRIRECHPEICFWALNQYQVIQSSKKTSLGLEERLNILSHYYPQARDLFTTAQDRYRRRDVALDDIVDGLVCAITATFSPNLKTLPEQPELDLMGFAMEIVYPDVLATENQEISMLR